MKNMYGVVERPQDLHAGGCNPGVADLNCIPAVRQKVRFTIGDAMSSVYDGGPGFHPERLWHPNALIVGEDRVALDQTAWQIIERKRAEVGHARRWRLRAVRRATSPPLPTPRIGLGANDPKRIQLDGNLIREDNHGRWKPDRKPNEKPEDAPLPYAPRGHAATAARGRRGGGCGGRGRLVKRAQLPPGTGPG